MKPELKKFPGVQLGESEEWNFGSVESHPGQEFTAYYLGEFFFMNSWRSGCISQYNWAANYQLSCLHLSGHLSTSIKLFFNPLRVKQGRWASHFVKESSFEKQHKEMCQKGQSTRSWETWSHDHQITLEGGELLHVSFSSARCSLWVWIALSMQVG